MPEHWPKITRLRAPKRSAFAAKVAAACRLAALALLIATLTPNAGSAAPPSVTAEISAAVLNDLGQLRWVTTTPTPLSPLEAEGRRLYIQSRRAFCHSQHAEPASAEARRWGPPVQSGEYAFDQPPQFGLRGIGPDLTRAGLKYGDEWHLGHFYNPPLLTQGSIMGGFSGFFGTLDQVKLVDWPGGRTIERTPATERLFDSASTGPIKLTPNAQGLLFVPLSAKGKSPLIWTPNDEFSGDSVKLVSETREVAALVPPARGAERPTGIHLGRGRRRHLTPGTPPYGELTVSRPLMVLFYVFDK